MRNGRPLEKPLDKTRYVESLLSKAGFAPFHYRLMLVLGLAQLGAYGAFTAGVIAGERIAGRLDLDVARVTWPDWIIKSAFAWIAGVFIDKFGRTFSLVWSLFLGTGFLIGSSFTWSLETYIVCRTFGCFFLGAIQVVTYVVVSEYVAQSQRVKCLFFLVLTDCLGTLYGCSMMVVPFPNLATALESLGGVYEPRFRLFISSLPLVAAFLLASVFIRKDSVKFLVISGKPDQALELVKKISTLPIDEPDFVRSVASMAVRPFERGTLSQVFKVTLTKPLLILWASQAIVYWGAMTALPRLDRVWRTPAGQPGSFQLEVLLLIYCFELTGTVSAAISALKLGNEKTFYYFSIAASALVMLTSVSLALNAGWFLAAIVCGTFACLTPIWGILFIITTEAFPVHCRAVGIGLMMSTRVCQGVLQLTLSTEEEFEATSWLPVVYSAVAGILSALVIYGTRQFFQRPLRSPVGAATMRSLSLKVEMEAPSRSEGV